jgi:hypothetical protein
MLFPGSHHAGFVPAIIIAVKDESRRYKSWHGHPGLPTRGMPHWTIEAAAGMGEGSNYDCEYQPAQHQYNFPIS